MFGIESLLGTLLGENKALWMIAGLFLLILLQFSTRIVIERKKKNLNWEDVTNFLKPLLLYGVLLVGLEFLVAAGSGVEVLHNFFMGLQFFAFGLVAAKYFKKLYANLKELGMSKENALSDELDRRIDSIDGLNKEEFEKMVDIYLEKKKAKKEEK